MNAISIDAVITEIFKAELWYVLSTFSEVISEFSRLYLELLVFHAKNSTDSSGEDCHNLPASADRCSN